MTDAAAPSAVAPAKPMFSDSYKGVVLGMLVLVYSFNFIDRTIIATIGQAIKTDLKLTDGQLGLLQGFAFALLYTLLGLPLARVAERFNRVTLITVCLVIWSGFTALCGMAQSFIQLLIFRVGVGIGEAGCSPPAQSLVSDYYAPQKRASALATYSFGIPLGAMVGSMTGGYLAEHLSWRAAFVIVGLPGILLALIFKLVVKEPPRGWSDREAGVLAPPVAPEAVVPEADPAPQGHWLAREAKGLAQVAGQLFKRRAFVHMIIGGTLCSFAGYGAGGFAPAYFVRMFGLSLTTVGLVFGLLGGLSNGAGTLLGGFLTDRLGKADAKWYALIPGIGLIVATPIYILIYSQQSWPIAAALLLLPGLFSYTYLGPTFGVMHNLVDARQRATATAILFFILNLIALGGGPPFTGWLIDLIANRTFEAHNLGLFTAACPGGLAPAGSAAALVTACHDTMAESTRWGQIVTVCIYAWAGLHYVIASRGIAKDLADAQAEQAAAQA